MYNTIQAQVNGKNYLSIGVQARTYVIWTAWRDLGCNLTKTDFGDVEIDGVKPPQVTQEDNTYIDWYSLPNVHAIRLSDGGWNFIASIDGNNTPSTDTLGTLLAEYKIDVMNDAFFFGNECPQIQLTDGSWVGVGHLQIDTGAFETMFSGAVAGYDKLPNLGNIGVEGVGGTASGTYKSQITIKIGNLILENQPCVVDPSWAAFDDGLWGAHTLISAGIAMYLNPKTGTLRYYKA